MKKILPGMIAIVAACSLGSCEDNPSNMGLIEHMRDTVLHSFSNINGTTLEVQDNEKLNVVLIGPSLQTAPEAEKQQMAGKVESMAAAVFKGSNVTSGKVVFSQQDPANMETAMTAPGYEIHFNKQ